MEDRYVNVAGREFRTTDANQISDAAAYADDNVLWELLRLRPGGASPDKGILTYGKRDGVKESGLVSTALIQAGTGGVKVMPFRAFVAIESPSTEKDELRRVYSGYLVGSSTQYETVNLSANAAADPRWAALYAIITPNADGPAASIVSKNTSDVVLPAASVVTYKRTTVTIGVVYGTANASPTRPSVPADGGGAYNILLGYVWQAAGFSGATAVDRKHIDEKARVYTMAGALGVPTIKPASGNSGTGGAADVNQDGENGTSAGAQRPSAYLPTTMVGGEERLIALQLTLSPASHVDGDIVDDSVDWRYRLFDWKLYVKAGNAATDSFMWDRALSSVAGVPSAAIGAASGQQTWGLGQSFVDDSAAWSGAGAAAVYATGAALSNLGGGGKNIGLYVDMSTGALKVKLIGSPTGQIFIWLRASGQYSNYGTV